MRRLRIMAFAATAASVGAMIACTGDTPDLAAIPPDAAVADAPSGDAPAEGNACGADLARDGKNCGACGHDCLGGACAEGKCEPLTIVKEGDGASLSLNTFIVADGRIYWSMIEPQAVPLRRALLKACDVASCAATTVTIAYSGGDGAGMYPTIATAGGIAVDAVHVYFSLTAKGEIHRCPKTGCPSGQQSPFAVSRGEPNHIVLDDATVYWASTGTADGIEACAKTGCGGTPRSLTPASGSVPEVPRFILAGDHVYFTSLSPSAQDLDAGALPLPGAPGVFRVPKGAREQTAERIIGDLVTPVGLAVDGPVVYFSDTGDPKSESLTAGRITKVTGSMWSTPLATELPLPTALVMDGPILYFLLVGDGTVRKCPLSDCTKPEVIARNQAGFVAASSIAAALALAQDERSLYWFHRATGEILRLAK